MREFVRVRERLIVSLLIAFGMIGIIATYPYLSHVFDESPHVGCGMQWWWEHAYNLEPKHPPLPRIMAASLLYFTGKYHVLSHLDKDYWWQGTDILYADGMYVWNLALARLGVLPFYFVSCVLVYRWSRRLFGVAPALLSLALYVTLPTVAAHAGVAATDMGYAATFIGAIMMTTAWLKKPDVKNSFLLGIVLALMLSSKLAALVHFPAALALIIAADYSLAPLQRCFAIGRGHFMRLLIVVPLFVFVFSGLYFFSFDAIWVGVKDLYAQNKDGHATWLFHALHDRGVWYYFPVVYFFKTPVAFLVSNGLSAWRVRRDVTGGQQNSERLFPFMAAIGIFIASMPSNINVGVRHVLPVYPLLAVPAGYGLMWLWTVRHKAWQPTLMVAMAVLAFWQLVGYVQSFPDRISYFNEIGEFVSGGAPEHISPDSDLDWGQGFILLGDAIERRHIEKIHACFWLGGSIRRLNVSLHIEPLECPKKKVPGWFAISRVEKMLHPEKYTWLEPYQPVENIGKTILLYHLP